MDNPAERPLISIVLTTFNGASFLPVQLNSLLAQTYAPIEIVAVDDASTDDSFNILAQYASAHPNVRVYRNEHNLGYIRNFEKACRLAAGQLIALCDQDDYWLPQKLEKLLATLGDAAMAYCNSAICNAQLEPTGVHASDRAVYKPIRSCLEHAIFCRIYGHATLFTRSLLEQALPFPGSLPHDWWLAYLAPFDGGINYLPDVLVYYRQHDHNAVGAIGERNRTPRRERARQKAQQRIRSKSRIQAFYDACPGEFGFEKKVLNQLNRSYQSFSFRNNWKRMRLFFRHYPLLLGVKKRNRLRNYLFCIKMFRHIQ